MSGQPLRPLFSEGQVLAGADLSRVVDHTAEAQARHERTLHTWGITEGLRLVYETRTHPTGAPYKRVSVTPGGLIDGTGRQVLVAEQAALDEGGFEQLNGATVTQANRTTWFPVFLAGLDQPAPPEGVAPTACGGQALPRRVVEGAEVVFGRAGAELALADQPVPPIDEGPGRTGADPWRVLLGFVQWNPDICRFHDVADAANGIGRRYAGAMADEVVARGGRIEARTQRGTGVGTPALVIDEEQGGRMYFGLHTGAGTVNPLLTVTADGNVEADGTIKGAQTTGSVHVRSGLATDGMILPLPAGISQEQVDKGSVTLHVAVTTHVPPSTAPSAMFAWVPRECRVDADRRVRCLVRWFDGGGNSEDRPAACDYLVLAAVPASSGGP
jgi:hypothetical protein